MTTSATKSARPTNKIAIKTGMSTMNFSRERGWGLPRTGTGCRRIDGDLDGMSGKTRRSRRRDQTARELVVPPLLLRVERNPDDPMPMTGKTD